jgi:BirA family transcriptional regulator, biotin operon repressor / biotin---[acetyl-CoA-carboxylase] ligase
MTDGHGIWPGGSPAGWPPGWAVSVVDETGSTNADLLAAAAAGAPHRTVLAARHQTAGRGRLDRTWEAPAGSNLLVSVLLREVPDRPHELTQRVALAAAQAAHDVAGADVVLKWPNDLLVGEAKLAGILAQATAGAVVVGLGMNVGWAPPGAARLGDDVDPLDVLRALLVRYDALPAEIAAEYRRRLATIGSEVRVELPAGTVVGRAVDVDVDGRLVVVDDHRRTHRFATGDVVHVRGMTGAR